MDSIQAAVLNTKLPHLDSYNKARQDSARKYSIALQNCSEIITPAFLMDVLQCVQIAIVMYFTNIQSGFFQIKEIVLQNIYQI